jgi:sugar fermentation stimulation protein A
LRLSEQPLTDASLIKRRNRFVAEVRLADGRETIAHVPNTGRMGELMVPGAALRLSFNPAPNRKTDYTLLAVSYRDHWVCIDATMANRLAYEYFAARPEVKDLRREVTRGDSRFDLAGRFNGRPGAVEVKSVNLVVKRGGRDCACFPDAPTARGRKHLRGLIDGVRAGYADGLCFVVQREDAVCVVPNGATDPAFAALLQEGISAGLRVTALRCRVTPDDIAITGELPVEAFAKP